MPATDWFEASDHWRWQQENEPDAPHMETINETAPASVPSITSDQVRSFLEDHLLRFREQAPGYITLEVESSCFEGRRPTVRFRAYCEHTKHSEFHESPEAAIDELVRKIDGRTVADLLRQEASTLLKRAEDAERKAAQLEGEGA